MRLDPGWENVQMEVHVEVRLVALCTLLYVLLSIHLNYQVLAFVFYRFLCVLPGFLVVVLSISAAFCLLIILLCS
jgi:hypothetical protein